MRFTMDWRTGKESAEQMSLDEFENKLMDYLISRKTAATAKQVAKYFTRSESYVGRVLRDLHKKGLIDIITAGKTKFYAVKE